MEISPCYGHSVLHLYEILRYFVLEGSLTFLLHCPEWPPPAPDGILKNFAMGIAWCYYGIIKAYFLDVGVPFVVRLGVSFSFSPFSPYWYLSRRRLKERSSFALFFFFFFQRRESWTSSVSSNYSSFSLGVRITVRSWDSGQQETRHRNQNYKTFLLSVFGSPSATLPGNVLSLFSNLFLKLLGW